MKFATVAAFGLMKLLNSAGHAVYGVEKVMTAWRSSVPFLTDSIWSYPLVAPTRKLLLLPLATFQVDSMACQSIGEPSLNCAFGLMVIVTTCLPPTVFAVAPV